MPRIDNDDSIVLRQASSETTSSAMMTARFARHDRTPNAARGVSSVGAVSVAGMAQSGPRQSNGMCLLDWPLRFHLKPKLSARSTFAVPHVATPPGPTSDPGGLIVCTRLPGGVVGPLSA